MLDPSISGLDIRNIVILTGAGISAESGIKTFRGDDGLWEGHRLEDVATPEAFLRNPDLVHAFHNQRRSLLLSPDIKPNPAHASLAELQRMWRGDVLLVTQNIDDLHERAGSDALHMHGELLRIRCVSCDEGFEWLSELETATPCPACQCTGSLRPDIVWFGEMPVQMERIEQALSDCDLFIAIGTSGVVYPAAGFVELANLSGAFSVELNLECSAMASRFAARRTGPASETVPEMVRSLLKHQDAALKGSEH